MVYEKTQWKNGSAPGISADKLNKIEKGIYDNSRRLIDYNSFSEEFPWYVAHRGAMNIYQENTMNAFENCVARGNRYLEMDVQKNEEGTLVVMHDSTMDRTTDGNWSIGTLSTAYLSTRSVTDKVTGDDYGYKKQPIPLLEDVLNRLGYSTNYIIESKDQSCAQEICEMVKKKKLDDYVIIQSFDLDDLLTIKDEGVRLMYLSNSISQSDIDTMKNNNVDYVGCNKNNSDGYIESLINNDFIVMVYTANHRFERDRLLSLGVHMICTDDPFYLQDSKALTTDRFREKVFHDGMLPCNTSYRGDFNTSSLSPYTWGFTKESNNADGRDFVVQGYLGYLVNNFELEFNVRFNNITTGWLSVAICLGQDYFDDVGNPEKSSGGYHLLFSEIGHLFIYKITDTGATLLEEYRTNETVNTNQSIPLKVAVGSTIKFERLDIPYSIETSDSSYRGGYVAFGRRTVRGVFSSVSIS